MGASAGASSVAVELQGSRGRVWRALVLPAESRNMLHCGRGKLELGTNRVLTRVDDTYGIKSRIRVAATVGAWSGRVSERQVGMDEHCVPKVVSGSTHPTLQARVRGSTPCHRLLCLASCPLLALHPEERLLDSETRKELQVPGLGLTR